MSGTIRRRGPAADFEQLVVAVVMLNLLAAWICFLLVTRKGSPWWIPLAVTMAAVDVAVFAVARRRNRSSVDSTARLLAGRRELGTATTAGALATAARLGLPDIGVPGIYVGKTVRGGRDIWGTWEEIYVDISGPATGKTESRCIPNIVAAPGPVLVTSCKRHIVDATRGLREQHGRTWVFDPLGLAGERPLWYWNPLSMIGGSMKDAASLAGLIMFTQRQAHMRTDAYFDPAAQTLMTLLMFAAAAEDLPITQVREWMLRPTDDSPAAILRAADHDVAAAAFEALVILPPSQRAGVYGAALNYMRWLAVPGLLPWMTAGDGREEFDFVGFSRQSTDTMYVLAHPDDRMAAPLIACLTAATIVAGETGSPKFPGGRLPRPFLVVLDDAAIAAQLPTWPDRLSHYGSRGINVMMMLQSWAQGAGVWGQEGMAKIWGAASIRVYGAGGSEPGLWDDGTKLAGDFEARTTSRSSSWKHMFGPGSVTHGSRLESILHPSDLSSLPKDRLIVQASGRRPVLARHLPWTEGPYAEQIRESLAKYAR